MLWVDCSSEATARADFKSIGSLCGWVPDKSDLLHGVKDQLASLDRPCLLLLDNCDDAKTNFSCYIPNSARVSVVLTTRLSDADKYASLNRQDTPQKLFVRMDGLDPASATQLILGASSAQEQSDETIQHAAQIADALDYHPLAIVVAGSLIQSNVYSIKEYAGALKDRLTQKELLETETEQSIYGKVSSTFEISATVLQDLSASDDSAQHALDLLDLLAFMHHQGVSEDMFLRAWEYEEEALSNSIRQDRNPDDLSMWHVAQVRKYFSCRTSDARKRGFLKARAHLIRLTLIQRTSEDTTTHMHPLLHLWARERIQNATKPWAAAASILALSGQGARGWQLYSPQLALHHGTNFRLKQSSGNIQIEGESVCRIWCIFAWQMLHTYHPQTSDVVERLAREVQSFSATKADALLVTEPQLMLAVLALRDGNTSQAVVVLEDVVRIRAKLAENHPSRLDSQHLLARAYLNRGRISEAIEILEHVVKLRKQCLADEHPSRLASQLMLAYAYLGRKRIPEAIETFEHVLCMREKLAADHPDRLKSQHHLALAYLKDGRISKAIETFEHVVRMREKLAVDHPDRLKSQQHLASSYLEDGRISQAIEMFEHVLHMREKLITDHPDLLVSQHMLAYAYLADGRIHEAIEILEHVVHIKEKLAADNPSRLASQHELARAYWHAARFAEADKLMRYVVDVRQRTLPKGHQDRSVSVRVLAEIRKDPKNPAAVSEDFTAFVGQGLGDRHESATPSTV